VTNCMPKVSKKEQLAHDNGTDGKKLQRKQFVTLKQVKTKWNVHNTHSS
jgi:hypothetical protein